MGKEGRRGPEQGRPPARLSQVDEQVEFVQWRRGATARFRPHVFPVSARLALVARDEANDSARHESRFESLERYVATTLDERGRLALKLASPLGVAERIGRTFVMAAEEKLARAGGRRGAVDSIGAQLAAYRADMQRDFALRLVEVENIMNEMIVRGLDYLDATLRIGRIVDLFRQKLLREEFERVVVGDAPERIDRVTQDLIDWMVDQDFRLWRTVTEQVERRRGATIEGPAARLAGSFEYDRRALLGSLGQTARGVLQKHNHQREAVQLASSVRDAVAQATLLEAGAVGLGAISMVIVGGAAADVTGLFAASVLAGIGLWVLPRKRRQAKAQFRARTEELRGRLLTAMRDEFQRELERSVQRIRDALAPYDRFVRAERERTDTFVHKLRAVSDHRRRASAESRTPERRRGLKPPVRDRPRGPGSIRSATAISGGRIPWPSDRLVQTARVLSPAGCARRLWLNSAASPDTPARG